MSKIKIEEQIGRLIVHFKGEFIGGDETDELRKRFKQLPIVQKIKFDMGKVTYLNSTALCILTSAYASVTKKGGKIVLFNLDKSIENLFFIN